MPKPRPFWDEPEENSPPSEPPGVKFTCTRRLDPFGGLVPYRPNRIVGGGVEIDIEIGLTSVDVSCSSRRWRMPNLNQNPIQLYQGDSLILKFVGLGSTLRYKDKTYRLNRSGLYDKLEAEDGTIVSTVVREWRDSRPNIVNYVYVERGELFGEDLPGVVAFLSLISQPAVP